MDSDRSRDRGSFLQLPSGKDAPFPSLVHLSAAGSHPYAAITDFLNCTFKFSSSDPLEALFSVLFCGDLDSDRRSSGATAREGMVATKEKAWVGRTLAI
jgi:hypothetical protein